MGMRSAVVICMGMVVLTLGVSAVGLADEESTASVQGRMRKLGRGIANVATAPAELIRTPELVGRRDGYLSAITIGVLQGTWRTVLRAVAGVYEVATFYLEIPPGFEPVMKPEFVWQHGGWVE